MSFHFGYKINKKIANPQIFKILPIWFNTEEVFKKLSYGSKYIGKVLVAKVNAGNNPEEITEFHP